MAELDQYNVSMATHRLKCLHAMGTTRLPYTMRCLVLKRVRSGKLKIVVFGSRYLKNTEHRKRIRYVPKWRVKAAGGAA